MAAPRLNKMDAATIKKKLVRVKNYNGFIFAKDIVASILKDGYYTVNLDREQPFRGTHWIGMAVDVNKKIVFIFDSFGLPPPDEIVLLKTQGFRVLYSSRQHQKASDSNCGEWSIRFIRFMHRNKNDFQKFLFSLI